MEVEETVIRPGSGWNARDLVELYRYRDMLKFFTWRNVKGRYSQAILGAGWALVQPVAYMVVFTVVFGNLAKISSEGVPYAVFSLTALVPWTYFSGALSDASASLVGNAALLGKVYFPRIILPLSAVAAKLVDLAIAFVLLVLILAAFRKAPSAGILMLPLLVLIMVFSAAGAGMWLTALAVRYRDVSYALGFLIQLLMYAAPVVYSSSAVPARYRLLYSINPMVGVVDGFRSALLGTHSFPWDSVLVGAVSSVLILGFGVWYFQTSERFFADIA